jgi:hypothetical protein
MESAQTLSDSADRTLLHALLSGPGRSLSDLAEALGTDILTLAERLTTPAFQAALDTLRHAATALAEIRALACGQIALTALAESCDESNPNPAERRRAASTLARFLPRVPPAAGVPLAACPPVPETSVPLPACAEVGSVPAHVPLPTCSEVGSASAPTTQGITQSTDPRLHQSHQSYPSLQHLDSPAPSHRARDRPLPDPHTTRCCASHAADHP